MDVWSEVSVEIDAKTLLHQLNLPAVRLFEGVSLGRTVYKNMCAPTAGLEKKRGEGRHGQTATNTEIFFLSTRLVRL